MDDYDGKLKTNTWRVDDLDVGLVNGLSKLQGLGSQELMEENNPAYNMTYVFLTAVFHINILFLISDEFNYFRAKT